jgi:hypothetical protein
MFLVKHSFLLSMSFKMGIFIWSLFVVFFASKVLGCALPVEDHLTLKHNSFTVPNICEALEVIGEGYRFQKEASREAVLSRLMAKGVVLTQPSVNEPNCLMLKKGLDVTLLFLGARSVDQSDCNKFFGTPLLYGVGRAHRGFANRLAESWDLIYQDIYDYAAQKGCEMNALNFLIAGHSMGGAMATLAGLRLAAWSFDKNQEAIKQHIHVITFGSPRVLDVQSAAYYTQLLGEVSLRVIHDGEGWTPSLPTRWNGSLHVGGEFNTPQPRVDESALRRPIHIFPAYRDSLIQLYPAGFSGKEIVEDTFADQIEGEERVEGTFSDQIEEEEREKNDDVVVVLEPSSDVQDAKSRPAETSGVLPWAWSGLKGIIGLPRWLLYSWTGPEPIEMRLSKG